MTKEREINYSKELGRTFNNCVQIILLTGKIITIKYQNTQLNRFRFVKMSDIKYECLLQLS